MADDRHVKKCWKCYNSLTNRPTWTKHGWSHNVLYNMSHNGPYMSAMMQLPWQRPLPSNGALDIQQL